LKRAVEDTLVVGFEMKLNRLGPLPARALFDAEHVPEDPPEHVTEMLIGLDAVEAKATPGEVEDVRPGDTDLEIHRIVSVLGVVEEPATEGTIESGYRIFTRHAPETIKELRRVVVGHADTAALASSANLISSHLGIHDRIPLASGLLGLIK